MPWRKGNSPLSAAPEYEDYLFEQWSHGDLRRFLEAAGIYAEGYWDRYADVPMVHLSGWYDPYARTAVENYLGLSRRGRAPQRLILGPWTHGDRSLTYAGEVDFGAAATLDGNLAEDFFALRRDWFDRWLKGVDNGVETRTAGAGLRDGRRHRAGATPRAGSSTAGIWRSAADWPLPQTRIHTLLPAWRPQSRPAPCRSVGGAAARLSLRPAPAGADDRRRLSARASRSCAAAPTISARGRRVFGARRPYRPLAERSDVLSFATAPLDREIEIDRAA